MEREELFNMESRWRIENYADNAKFRRDGLKSKKDFMNLIIQLKVMAKFL